MPKLLLQSAIVIAALATSAHAQTQSPEASQIQDLTNCAGAVAAHANINVVAHPRGASGEWSDLLGRILARLNVEPGVEGMTGRYAASAARADWNERPAAEQEAAANQCRERYRR